MSFWDLLTTVGGKASAISAIIACVALVLVKPVKQAVTKHKKKKQEAAKKREEEEKAEQDFRDEMRSAITELRDSIKDIKSEQMESEKERIRATVFRIEAECRRGQKHSLEEFRHMPELKAKYEKLLAATGDTNGVFTDAYDYIMDCYHEARENNDFLV